MAAKIAIAQVMNRRVVTVSKGDRVGDAVEIMASAHIGAVPVVDGERLVGIFSERDFLRMFVDDPEALGAQPVDTYMTPDPVCARSTDDFASVLSTLESRGIRHMPVVDDGNLVGIISIRDLTRLYESRLEAEAADAHQEVERLKDLMRETNQDAVELLLREVERYRGLSLTDDLTGLYNKRYFNARLEEELARAKRHGHELALVFCDIDHFKRINDRFGHQFGDGVLRGIAEVLASQADDLHIVSRLRKSDIVARFGGEEFVAILPDTSAQGAAVAAETIRRRVAEQVFNSGDEEVSITVSLGVASHRDGEDIDTLIRRADVALYRAKERGRNMVEVAPE